MAFVSIVCPKCAGELQVPEELKTLICMYCGETIEAPRTKQNDGTLAAKLDEMESAADEQKVAVAREIIEIAPQNGKANFVLAIDMLTDELVFQEGISKVFTKYEYPYAFEKFYEKLLPVLVILNRACKEENAAQIAKEFGRILGKRIMHAGRVDGAKKPKLDDRFDAVYMFVAFFIPSALKCERPFSEPLADSLVNTWNERFPEQKIKKATYEKINDGFKYKLCFITTAVCQSLGKPDHCRELTAFRSFRDEWLAMQPGGLGLINQYYLLAPLIVNEIDRKKEAPAIYNEIWQTYLSRCLAQYQNGQLKECLHTYETMFYSLSGRFFQ